MFEFRRLAPLLLLLSAGCGYTLQGSHSPLLEKEGIRRIYVTPLVNNTYKPGIENIVYNALVKTVSAHRRVELVSSPNAADAVLSGTVNDASSSPNATTDASALTPAGTVPANTVTVATDYNANLSCSFTLARRNPPPGKRAVIWSSSFSRGKPFPTTRLAGGLAESSGLINDSEFERALADLATSMMGDLHESMLAMF
jgi:hypothetical protein